MFHCTLAGGLLRDAVAMGMKGAWRPVTGSMRALGVLELLLRIHVSRTSLKLAWGEGPTLCGALASLPGCSCSAEHRSAMLPQRQFRVFACTKIFTTSPPGQDKEGSFTPRLRAWS